MPPPCATEAACPPRDEFSPTRPADTVYRRRASADRTFGRIATPTAMSIFEHRCLISYVPVEPLGPRDDGRASLRARRLMIEATAVTDIHYRLRMMLPRYAFGRDAWAQSS